MRVQGLFTAPSDRNLQVNIAALTGAIGSNPTDSNDRRGSIATLGILENRRDSEMDSLSPMAF